MQGSIMNSQMAKWSEDFDARSVSKDQQTDPIQTNFIDTVQDWVKEVETKRGKAVVQERKVLEGEGKAQVKTAAQQEPCMGSNYGSTSKDTSWNWKGCTSGPKVRWAQTHPANLR